jgi:hypothetical protein
MMAIDRAMGEIEKEEGKRRERKMEKRKQKTKK